VVEKVKKVMPGADPEDLVEQAEKLVPVHA
jgi:hypothetical protein